LDITEADVRQLVNAGLEEHLQLEYKSALNDGNDQGSKESLLDICMFANADGGILLIGISEQRDANNQPGLKYLGVYSRFEVEEHAWIEEIGFRYL
jgi:predicted HTH transcriptional regulator